jgi:hypothetical protein
MDVQIVTANRLTDGLVVFLGPGGRWVERVAESETAADTDRADALLARAGDAVAAQEVVDPYLVDAIARPAGPMPTRYRERLRAFGPSVETRVTTNTNAMKA